MTTLLLEKPESQPTVPSLVTLHGISWEKFKKKKKKNKKTPLTGAGCQIKNCRFPISFAVQAVDYE